MPALQNRKNGVRGDPAGNEFCIEADATERAALEAVRDLVLPPTPTPVPTPAPGG